MKKMKQVSNLIKNRRVSVRLIHRQVAHRNEFTFSCDPTCFLHWQPTTVHVANVRTENKTHSVALPLQPPNKAGAATLQLQPLNMVILCIR